MKKFQKMLSLKNKSKNYKINEEINLKDNYSRKSDINIVKKRLNHLIKNIIGKQYKIVK